MGFKTQSFQWHYKAWPLSYGAGDFNGDGMQDFAFGGLVFPLNEARPFNIISADASGVIHDTTSILASLPYAVHPREMYVGDLNGDGVDDFYSANHGYDAPPFPGELNTLLLSSGGRLFDQTAALPQRAGFTHSVAGGDIDKDGDTDLFVGVLGGGGPYFLMNDGKGGFTERSDPLPARLDGIALDGRFASSLLLDIDNDGWLDLILGSDEHGATAGLTYLNDKSGGFHTSGEDFLPVGVFGAYGTIVTDFLSVDLNEDGYSDLILAETDGNPFYEGQMLQILINDGTGGFRDETAARVEQTGGGRWTQNLKAIDFNNDAKLDLLAQTDLGRAESQTILWLNKGDGSFAPLPARMLEGFAGTVVPMDFNHDSRIDFLSFNSIASLNDPAPNWDFNSHLNTAGDLSFDEALYYARNQDVANAGIDARVHFDHYGWTEGRDPNRLFDTEGYLANNPDVAAAGMNPFDHYALYGWHEGRDPGALFDTAAYLAANPDVAAAGINPLQHYLNWGAAEGRAIFAVEGWL